MGEKQTSPGQRRDYSRGGCRECKRRKIKCDESKPKCSHCKRLNKDCAYPKEGEKVLRVSRRYLDENPSPSPQHHIPKTLNIQVYHGPKAQKRRKKKVRSISTDPRPNGSDDQPPIKIESTTAPPSISPVGSLLNDTPSTYDSYKDSSLSTGESYFKDSPLTNVKESPLETPFPDTKYPPLSMSPFQNDQVFNDAGNSWKNFYSNDDLNLLASDLNTIVNDIMFQSNFKGKDESGDIAPTEPKVEPISAKSPYSVLNATETSEVPSVDAWTSIPRNLPVDYIKVTSGYERFYLEDFYHGFANQLLPFGAYIAEENVYANPIRDVILYYASKEPFLLAAILAQGAKTSYEKNHLERDQEAYGSYLSTCLTLLEPALPRNREKDIACNVECILLTVLLLTSENAANKKQSWRPHLKGAKDIILKATKSNIRQSKTLVICKVWFIDFEVLAGLSSPFGGTLKTDEELDQIVNINNEYEYSVLKEFGIIRENGFNIMFGYNNTVAYLFRDLIKIFNKKRNEEADFKANQSMEYIRLISGFYQQHKVTYGNPNCVGPEVEGELVDHIFLNNENIYISWMDLAQQAYTLAAIITILTELMGQPFYMPHVQDLVGQLMSLIAYLEKCPTNPRHYFEHSVSMIQWPMYVAALNCTEEHHKYLLIKFFRMLADLGSGSAEHALIRIMKAWDGKEGDEEKRVDIVAY